MQLTVKCTFLLLTALALQSCVSRPMTADLLHQPQPEKALVYLYRPKNPLFYAAWPTVNLDNKKIDTLKTGQCLALHLRPGGHTLSFDGVMWHGIQSPNHSLFIKKGETRFLALKVTDAPKMNMTGIPSGKWHVEVVNVDRESALNEMSFPKKIHTQVFYTGGKIH